MRIRTKIRIFQGFTALLMCALVYEFAFGLHHPRWDLVIGLSVVCIGWILNLEYIKSISDPFDTR